MAEPARDARLGCLWGLAVILFVPAGFVTAAVWPDITANQFVGRTLLIGAGCGLAVLLFGGAVTVARHRH
ncbi:hypothetical protein [Microlunatus ginsengisoli]|uniref:Uncharacterized protein n=1 Tax=Microlunatus ginsengisoli TaxID=363863 RepID=A0ABP7AEI6_9ACTN